MNVGNGQLISNKWIPKGVDTGLVDINNIGIKTRDIVSVCGCMQKYAVVGKDMNGRFCIFFGTKEHSVEWFLDQEEVNRHKIKVVKGVTLV